MTDSSLSEPASRADQHNLPAKHVIHTVGPIVADRPTSDDREQLAACYCSCLTLATDAGLESIAFCCISTGEYRFPKAGAAKIAAHTVETFRRDNPAAPDVIFNVFTDEDFRIYEKTVTRT